MILCPGQHRPGPGDTLSVPGSDGEPGWDDGARHAQAQGHPEDRGQRRLPHQGHRDHQDVELTSYWSLT